MDNSATPLHMPKIIQILYAKVGEELPEQRPLPADEIVRVASKLSTSYENWLRTLTSPFGRIGEALTVKDFSDLLADPPAVLQKNKQLCDNLPTFLHLTFSGLYGDIDFEGREVSTEPGTRYPKPKPAKKTKPAARTPARWVDVFRQNHGTLCTALYEKAKDSDIDIKDPERFYEWLVYSLVRKANIAQETARGYLGSFAACTKKSNRNTHTALYQIAGLEVPPFRPAVSVTPSMGAHPVA